MLPPNAVQAAQDVLLPYLGQARCVLDGTAGNGRDTLFLARHIPNDAIVWSFDIQKAALAVTHDLLAQHELTAKVRLIHDSHAKLADYVDKPIDAAMFNLGYLPGGSHDLATQTESTVAAVSQTAQLLSPGGIMTIVAYPGHPAGYQENESLAAVLSALPQRLFSVACWQMLNQINCPPVLYAVEKRREHKR